SKHVLVKYACFFLQAEDGIRDRNVTGVQTCALPISRARTARPPAHAGARRHPLRLLCRSATSPPTSRGDSKNTTGRTVMAVTNKRKGEVGQAGNAGQWAAMTRSEADVSVDLDAGDAPGTIVKDSVVPDSATIGSHTSVIDSTVGENATIGDNVVLNGATIGKD